MSLPTLSTLNTTQDTNKQLSIIRSYLVQLKDELEAELSNVTYEMLSASLQKRIDSISDDIAGVREENYINAQMITSDYAKLGVVIADTLTASKVYAKQVGADTLNAANANIGSLRTEILDAGYVNATQVDAQIATFKYVNASQVNSIIGNYHFITADYINATNICSALSDARQGTITIGTVSATSLKVYDQNDYKPIKFTSGTVGGKTAFFAYHE